MAECCGLRSGTSAVAAGQMQRLVRPSWCADQPWQMRIGWRQNVASCGVGGANDERCPVRWMRTLYALTARSVDR